MKCLTLVALLAIPTIASAQNDGLPPPKPSQSLKNALNQAKADMAEARKRLDAALARLKQKAKQLNQKLRIAEEGSYATHLRSALRISGDLPAAVTSANSVWTPKPDRGASGSLADTKPRGPVQIESVRVRFGDALTVTRVTLPTALDALDWAGSHPGFGPSGDTALRMIEARGPQAVLIEGTLLEKNAAKVRKAVWSYQPPTSETLLLATARGDRRQAGQVYVAKGQFYAAAKRALDRAHEKRKEPVPGISYRWYSPRCVRITLESVKLEVLIRFGKQGAFFSVKPIGEKSSETALLKQLAKQSPVVAHAKQTKPVTKQGDAKGAAQQLENKIK